MHEYYCMKKFYIYFIPIVFVFVACSNSTVSLFEQKIEVLFTVPLPSQVYAPTHMVYLDENFSMRTILLSDVITKAGKIVLRVKKNQFTPILVYSGDEDGKPYGCMYPLSTEASIAGGFSAWIFYKFFMSSKESSRQIYTLLSRFNWKRFDTYIQKREDPWLLDQQRILEDIADGSFSVYSLRDK